MLEYLSHYIVTVAQLGVDLYFAQLFFKSGKVTRAAVAASLIALPMPFINSMESMLLNFLSAFTAVIVVLLVAFKEKTLRLLIMSLAICVLHFLCELVTVFFSSLILYDSTENVIAKNIFNVLYAFIALLLFFTIACVVKIILSRQQSENPVVFTANFRVLMLTTMTIILGYYIMYSSQFHQSTMLSGIGLVIFILLIVVDVAVMLGSENDMKKLVLTKNLEVMKLQEEYNVETIRQLEDNQSTMAKQAHDFKNHLICIEEMIRGHRSKSELDEADEYVHGLVQEITRIETESDLGIKNTALRAMVRRLKRRCLELDIALHVDIQYSDFSFMQFQDICSFFSNAFDNAIWACQQIGVVSSLHKVISVDIEKRNSYLRIKITNTTIVPAVKSKYRFVSQKSSSGRTGIGTQNMMKSIEQYGGTVEMDTEGNLFTALAILPLSQPD